MDLNETPLVEFGILLENTFKNVPRFQKAFDLLLIGDVLFKYSFVVLFRLVGLFVNNMIHELIKQIVLFIFLGLFFFLVFFAALALTKNSIGQVFFPFHVEWLLSLLGVFFRFSLDFENELLINRIVRVL